MTRPRTRRLKEHMEWSITTKRGYQYKDTQWTNTLDCSCCIQYSIRNLSNEKHVWIEEYEHGPECAIMCDGIIDDLIDTCIVWNALDCTVLRHIIIQYRPNQFTWSNSELPF